MVLPLQGAIQMKKRERNLVYMTKWVRQGFMKKLYLSRALKEKYVFARKAEETEAFKATGLGERERKGYPRDRKATGAWGRIAHSRIYKEFT